jgi:ABC-type sugar transport system substrate-binding protein
MVRKARNKLAPMVVGAAVAALALSVVAIGRSPDASATVASVPARATSLPSGRHFVIGSMINDLTNPFLATMGKAEEAAARRDHITIHVDSGDVDGTINISDEIAEVQQFISQKVSAILVTASDAQAIVPVIKEANKAGIPVIAVNTTVGSGAKIVTFVGDDDYQYGADEGLMVAKAIGGKGDVAILLGVLGDSPEVLRTEGIKATLARYPKIHIVTSLVDNWVNSTNISDIQDLASKYPSGQLKAVVAEGPEMYAGAEYARSHKILKGTKFVAGDYSTEVKTAIENGDLYGTVDQSPQLEGSLGVKAAFDWLTGRRALVVRPHEYIALPLVTRSNVTHYPATWSS